MRYGGLWGAAAVCLVLAGGALMDRAGREQPRAIAAWQQAAATANTAQQRVQVLAVDALAPDGERRQARAAADDAWATAALAAERAGTAGSVDQWTLNTGFTLKMLGLAVTVGVLIGEGVGIARAHRAASTPG